MASVCIWSKDTLCAEVYKSLEVGIHDYFLFISVLERLYSGYCAFSLTFLWVEVVSSSELPEFLTGWEDINVDLTVIMEVHRCKRAISPRRIFIKTVSAKSSALCPVATQFTPSNVAPLSSACLLNTPQKVQLFFRPICAATIRLSLKLCHCFKIDYQQQQLTYLSHNGIHGPSK